jgi:5'(3')-deoxyribonucleotidase
MRDKSKKLIYVDMDGVLADFITPFLKERMENPGQPYPHSQYGFFMNLEPIKDSIESFKMLEEHFDMWILTRPSVQNTLCYTEKAIWVKEKLGLHIQRKTVMCCDKSLLKGDFLIDDTLEYGQTEFEGELLHFGSDNKFPDWKTVVDYLMTKI